MRKNPCGHFLCSVPCRHDDANAMMYRNMLRHTLQAEEALRVVAATERNFSRQSLIQALYRLSTLVGKPIIEISRATEHSKTTGKVEKCEWQTQVAWGGMISMDSDDSTLRINKEVFRMLLDLLLPEHPKLIGSNHSMFVVERGHHIYYSGSDSGKVYEHITIKRVTPLY